MKSFFHHPFNNVTPPKTPVADTSLKSRFRYKLRGTWQLMKTKTKLYNLYWSFSVSSRESVYTTTLRLSEKKSAKDCFGQVFLKLWKILEPLLCCRGTAHTNRLHLNRTLMASLPNDPKSLPKGIHTSRIINTVWPLDIEQLNIEILIDRY